jgi:beta-lactamase regulating signal transducer with metallopeptidase domain
MTIPLFSSSVIGSIPQTATIEAFGWALVHFVWQGAAIALALGAFLVFARRLSPQVRYVAGCAALSLMALGACSTFAWHIARAAGQSTPEITVAASIDSPRPTPRVEALVADRLLEQNASPVPDSVALPLRTGAGEKGAQDHETAGESISSPIDLSTPRTTLSAGWTNRLRACLPWVVAFWGAGVGLLSLRLAHGWQTIRRLRDTGVEFADPVWSERIARLQKRLGISRSVRFLSSAGAAVPMVIGALKPVILLPVGMLAGLSALQVEALLVHELAHIRRHDYIVNLIQNLLETLCFYHPAVWWVSGQIRKEREHCCDDVASAACGALDYAQALASLAELRQASPSFGLAANGTPLVDRIRRLAGVDPSSQSTAGWLAVLALVALVTAIALRPADRTHADGQDTKTVKGTVLLAQGRPLADADVVGESHQHRYGPARTNGQGRFELQVPTGIVIESYRVSLPHSFVVSVTLDKRAPLALCLQRWAASAKVEKQEPLVLKVVETHYPWGGYWPPSKKKSSPQTNASGKSVRRIAGKVVDHDGKPLADAHVWWIVFDHGVRRPTVLAECACDRAGRFRMEISSDGKPPATRPNDELWALAPGKKSNALGETEKLQVTEGPATSNVSSEVVIHLDPAPDFSFLVNNAGGRPVGGASLERLWCGQYFPGALLGEFLADPEWPAPFRDRDRVTTDASGVAHLSAHSDEIRITARECGIQTIHLPHVQPPVFPIGGKERYVVKRRSINLRPVGRVEGQVIADDLRSVRGIKLRISTSWEQSETFVEGSAIVMTDDAGQFVIPAIAAGKLRFKLLDAPANPSLIPVARHIDVRAQETTHLEIRMERPVLIDGMIRAERTGEPIAGAEIYLGGGLQQGEKLTSNAQGQYHARFPAGQILLKEISLPDERHADYQQWFSGVRPGRTVPSSMHSPPMWKVALSATVDGKPRDLPAIVRIPTKMLEGLAIDAAGRPLVKAFVKAENGLGRYVATTDGHGEFEMQVPKASKFKSYYVWLPDRLGTDVKIQKQEPLALKVDAISASEKGRRRPSEITDSSRKVEAKRTGASSARFEPSRPKNHRKRRRSRRQARCRSSIVVAGPGRRRGTTVPDDRRVRERSRGTVSNPSLVQRRTVAFQDRPIVGVGSGKELDRSRRPARRRRPNCERESHRSSHSSRCGLRHRISGQRFRGPAGAPGSHRTESRLLPRKSTSRVWGRHFADGASNSDGRSRPGADHHGRCGESPPDRLAERGPHQSHGSHVRHPNDQDACN